MLSFLLFIGYYSFRSGESELLMSYKVQVILSYIVIVVLRITFSFSNHSIIPISVLRNVALLTNSHFKCFIKKAFDKK